MMIEFVETNPDDHYRALPALHFEPPGPGIDALYRNIAVLRQVPVVGDLLDRLAETPPTDAVSSEILYTLNRGATGPIQIVFYYRVS